MMSHMVGMVQHTPRDRRRRLIIHEIRSLQRFPTVMPKGQQKQWTAVIKKALQNPLATSGRQSINIKLLTCHKTREDPVDPSANSYHGQNIHQISFEHVLQSVGICKTWSEGADFSSTVGQSRLTTEWLENTQTQLRTWGSGAFLRNFAKIDPLKSQCKRISHSSTIFIETESTTPNITPWSLKPLGRQLKTEP